MKKLLAALALAVVAALAAAIPAMSATPPVFPDNIVIFPDRDFLAIEGYEGHVGQTATITIERNGVTTGQAQGTIAAGDPALEVNHPGGVCWGTGPGAPRVTPNIKPGDVVTLSVGGTSDSAKTLGAHVTGFRKAGTDQLIVNGNLGSEPEFSRNRLEQRVIAPDLDPTDVGRRDIRAPSRPGPYTSTLEFPTTTTFQATYTFVQDANTSAAEVTEMRDIAAEGQMRALSWMQTTGADGNRQGLTISEFGEVGGPGMGGCPAGPENAAPNAPTNVKATPGDSSVTATWDDATTIPDSPAITGYRLTVINQANGVESAVRVGADANIATVPGLVNNQSYAVEVTAISAAGTSQPGTAGPVTPTATQPPPPTTENCANGADDDGDGFIDSADPDCQAPTTQPNPPTIGTAVRGAADPAITATANWSAVAQPQGVNIDGWRVTAYRVDTGARIKSAFSDEPLDPAGNARTKSVTFGGTTAIPSGTRVQFTVQAIDAEGDRSAASAKSNDVAAR